MTEGTSGASCEGPPHPEETLHPTAEALRDYMSELSELAYSAGWMQGLEHALWSALLDGPCRYGHLDLRPEHLQRLRDLSERAGGWIHFPDTADEEVFVPLEEWQRVHAVRVRE